MKTLQSTYFLFNLAIYNTLMVRLSLTFKIGYLPSELVQLHLKSGWNYSQEMEDSSSSLSCNSCRAHIDGIAYRTSCLHLLCSACAKHSFADGRTCLICGTVLSKGKVKEVVIGVPAQVEISSSLFQMAFSSANLGSIVDNLDSMRHAFAELENLVSTQLLLETSQLQRSAGKALQDNEILHDQLVRS